LQLLLRASRAIDRLNDLIGRNVYWLILVAVLVSASNAMVRYAFDVYETPYDLIFKDEVKKGFGMALAGNLNLPTGSTKDFTGDGVVVHRAHRRLVALPAPVLLLGGYSLAVMARIN